ncbi:MAG: heavy metal translocating P-type ATPase [Acidimicrobiia bacterium]
MRTERTTRLILYATAGALAVGGLLRFGAIDLMSDVAWTLAASVPLFRLVGRIISNLRQRRPGIDVIALLAVVAALVLGEFLTAAIIGLMLATGQYLEGFAAGRAERELTALIQRAPRTAHRIFDGEIKSVGVDEVGKGDQLLVMSGEVLPVDGVLASDFALLDESALTGEAMPVEHRIGDLISSGTVNAADSFEIRAAATAEESTYAGIVRLVQEARESRSPGVRLADRWAGWFVPLTLVVAAGTAAVSGDPVRALAVLVVATPCPLLLAVPIAIVSGISRAARRGIVFRGGGPLEALARTRNVLIDKTGTVTVGQPSLRAIVTFQSHIEEDEALHLAASVDQTSTHVLARAIVFVARQRGLSLEFPTNGTEVAGAGVSAKVGGRTVKVGRIDWLLDGTAEPKAVTEFRQRMLRVAPLIVFLAVDGVVVAAFTFDDPIRPDAATTMRALRRVGVKRIVMATGDHPVVAQAVGMAVDVDEVLAECTPGDKVQAVHELREYGFTTMVGDGINDAPALAAADVGVAMGARGATASSEAADVILMVDRLQGLVEAISIAQRSRRIAVQSVAVGMSLSLIAMIAASAGLLIPIAGAMIQEGIDIIAIGSALRALFGKDPIRTRPQLSPELTRRLRVEHETLIPKLALIQEAADGLDQIPSREAQATLEGIRSLLLDEILPHEAEDERIVYPKLASLLGGNDPLAAMSRTHREIFHLVNSYQRLLADLPVRGPQPADMKDLRRILYSLHAILRLHFDQEEELYFSLNEEYANPVPPEETSEKNPDSPRPVSV